MNKSAMRRPCRFVLLAVMLTMAGCGSTSSSVSIDQWQHRLDQFATAHHSGDLSFLRLTNPSSPHQQFAVFGGESPQKSTDVVGVFLGRARLAGRHRLIFLVARVQRQSIQEMRIALRTDEPGMRDWLISDQQSLPTQAYIAYRQSQWRRYHPDRTGAKDYPLAFPAEDDDFRLLVNADRVTITEAKSGVRWEFDPLPRPDRAK